MADFPLPSNLSVIKAVDGSNPAPNTEFSQTVPAGKWWWLLAVSVSLFQGATQTPQPILIVDDGTVLRYEGYGATAAQAVTTTAQYTWAVGLPAPGTLIGATPNLQALAPLPSGLILPAGWRIRSNTLGLGANSDYGAPSFFVVELG